MTSDPLRASLEAYFGRHPEERDMLAVLDGILPQGECLFDRATLPHHWTASAWIVDSACRNALLLFHPRLNRWLQPGGHADGEADLPRVALREAHEETGLTTLRLDSDAIFDFDVNAIPACGADPPHDHLDARFLIWADSTEPMPDAALFPRAKWVSLESLESAPDAGVRRMSAKTRALRGR
ncbi:MAG TPA: NUDIX domain-containing protein [Allosphingosinicella sp.]|jgi:ADP-ribose pyrophosphatase YjhB (NUDIX family)